MQYTTAPSSTLFVKVRVRKSPYSNKTVSLRISADYYASFKPSKAMLIRELNPNCGAQQLSQLIARLQKEANALNVVLDPASLKTLEKMGG
jgi:hypothetical protein